jgi:hypothetical protein
MKRHSKRDREGKTNREIAQIFANSERFRPVLRQQPRQKFTTFMPWRARRVQKIRLGAPRFFAKVGNFRAKFLDFQRYFRAEFTSPAHSRITQ